MGTRSALPSFERQPPFQSGTPQILRQEAFQVLKRKLCQHAASGQLLKKQKKNYETNKTKTKQGTNPGILLNSAPRGHNIDTIRLNMIVKFISEIWVSKIKILITYFYIRLQTLFPLNIEK